MRLSAKRRAVIERIARHVPPAEGDDCVRVAVDGVDGSGKTMFADELAAAVKAIGRPVVRVSLDDFLNTRTVRYRQGRASPRGFWEDSYNYERFERDVLVPFAPGGSRRYRSVAYELKTDSVLHPERRSAEPATVLVVDGLFLHRDELAPVWDLSVFLDVPFSVTARRMALRDGSDPDPEHPTMHRYVEGQRIYFRACSPQQRAAILIDNRDIDAPRVVRHARSS
ncbi:uridine kinase [Krasilnikovia cinnamomea]|uniref:Uridine kinase n=1 Tax=Krasilnikovia cinnamomea TaxID=349313 RepID=A0A4Q7ZKJ5_9ACTN|nr:uridine kinase [Krasilnikovia cinnamomea]RZU50853.1 uridine kinase [Krasilnikovia cinnamomea]